MSDDDSAVGQLFDATIVAIVQKIETSKADGLERTMAHRQGQR